MSGKLQTKTETLTQASDQISAHGQTLEDAHGPLVSKTSGLEFASGVWKAVVGEFVHDVVSDVVAKVPSQLSDAVNSYAYGLTHLNETLANTDEALKARSESLHNAPKAPLGLPKPLSTNQLLHVHKKGAPPSPGE